MINFPPLNVSRAYERDKIKCKWMTVQKRKKTATIH